MQEAKDIKVGDVYYHLKKGMYKNAIRRKLRVDALYIAKGLKGKPDKPVVACTDIHTKQPYQPLQVKNFLNNYKEIRLTKGEAFIYNGQIGNLSGFFRLLYKTISKADGRNRTKLFKAFPDEVAIFSSWSFDDIADKVNLYGANSHYNPWAESEVVSEDGERYEW